jgi:1-acyl-sn-glycerol-3-phosphate acyltransferase
VSRIPRVLERAVESLIVRELRAAFHSIRLVGPLPESQKPVVLYANHHSVHDGYALWYIARRIMHRKTRVWMQQWDRYPFFAAAGARPFPMDDPAARIRTIRQTRTFFNGNAASALVYFPEGEMHPAENGVRVWSNDAVIRLDRLLGEPAWLPFALHTSWRAHDRPELFILPGELQSAPEVGAMNLEKLLAVAPDRSLGESTSILSGRKSSNERDFSRLAGYFRNRI